jgi:hypothetical protein
VGSSTYPVTVSELTGADRDTVYAEQVRRLPGFGEYAQRTEGIRTIPVLELRRRHPPGHPPAAAGLGITTRLMETAS